MGVLDGKCADVKLAEGWRMGMARGGLGGGGWCLVVVVCGSVVIIGISEGVINQQGGM